MNRAESNEITTSVSLTVILARSFVRFVRYCRHRRKLRSYINIFVNSSLFLLLRLCFTVVVVVVVIVLTELKIACDCVMSYSRNTRCAL